MSYVAISSTLTNQVIQKIDNMRRADIANCGALAYEMHGTLPVFMHDAWGEHLPFVMTLPEVWIGECEYRRLYFQWVADNGTTRTGEVKIRMVPTTPTPPNCNLQYEKLDIDLEMPEFAAILYHYKNTQECGIRWDKVTTDVMKFLHSCKSLNEALKLWPQIEAYIPLEPMAKVAEKKPTTTKKSTKAMDALAELDIEHLTSAAVIASLVGIR